jgi:acetyltransferase-like isoleucine patch superfamily enzyme
MRVFICEPLFKAYCTRYGRGVTTGVFIHWVQGNGDLSVGNRVMMDGKSSIIFAARYAGNPTLTIGDHTFVGHNTTFVVGKSIYIGRHCLLSTDVCLRDCDGHPVSPDDRAAGLSAPADEVRGITIGDNVWIGMRAIILKGVTIGDNSIVGAGAVVTRDVPANAVVAGNPAKLVRHLDYCEYAVSQMPVTLETATNGAP